MTYIEQRTNNDCTICCVAMFLGYSYEHVEAIAKNKLGYEPNNGTGLNVCDLLDELGKEPKLKVRKIIVKPCMVSVPSVNYEGKRHLVILTDDGVIDPSPLDKVTEDHLHSSVCFSYWV